MPAAIPAAIWISSAIAAGGTVAGATIASKSAKNSAKTQAASAQSAAELQDAAAKRQLAYEQQQSDIANANAEVNRKANYDQYVAQRQRMSGIAQHLGLPAENIPAYTPGVYTSGGIGTPTGAEPGGVTGQTSTPGGQTPPVDGSAESISAFFKSQGASDHETPYWVQKWPELVARGQELGDPNYAMKRLQAADVLGGGGGQSSAQPYAKQTLGQLGAPQIAAAAPAESPIYQRPNPYTTGSIGGLSFRG